MIQEQFISNALQHLADIDRDIITFTLRLKRDDLAPKLRRINTMMLAQAQLVRANLNKSLEVYYTNNIEINHILVELQSR